MGSFESTAMSRHCVDTVLGLTGMETRFIDWRSNRLRSRMIKNYRADGRYSGSISYLNRRRLMIRIFAI